MRQLRCRQNILNMTYENIPSYVWNLWGGTILFLNIKMAESLDFMPIGVLGKSQVQPLNSFRETKY